MQPRENSLAAHNTAVPCNVDFRLGIVECHYWPSCSMSCCCDKGSRYRWWYSVLRSVLAHLMTIDRTSTTPFAACREPMTCQGSGWCGSRQTVMLFARQTADNGHEPLLARTCRSRSNCSCWRSDRCHVDVCRSPRMPLVRGNGKATKHFPVILWETSKSRGAASMYTRTHTTVHTALLLCILAAACHLALRQGTLRGAAQRNTPKWQSTS